MALQCINYFRASLKVVTAGLSFTALAAVAQTSGLLQLQQIQVSSGGPVQFMFNDYGTGATNYAVQFSSGLASGQWQVDSNAVITPQGGGAYQVQINEALGTNGFYRVSGLGGTNGALVITFSTPAFQVVEGETVNTMLVLSQPFTGWIYYTVSGTAGAGDFQMLSGSNYVNGTMLTIPVSLTDDNQVSQLKYLTLRLETGSGYALGKNPSTTITIGENDANWSGTFITDDATLGFTLMIDESNGVYQATFKGNGSGLFPSSQIPAVLNLTPNTFSATASGIPLAASATLLNIPANLRLLLNAMNGVTNQSVSEMQIQGTGELIAQYTGQPQLDTTNQGTFLLLKPPVAPSTNQVQLVNAP